MATKPLKGATPLKLNNAELRRELIRADRIIDCTIANLNAPDKTQLLFELNESQITTPYDPFAYKSRKQAMHRITPKRDYAKIALIITALFFAFAWYCAQTENQLLEAEASIAAIQLQGV